MKGNVYYQPKYLQNLPKKYAGMPALGPKTNLYEIFSHVGEADM